MSELRNKWPKKITVDKRIVRILSGSTYANFPSAIRELITNSYDADAESVEIKVDEINEIITLTDNGKGMSEDDFAFYLRIAGKSRKKEDTKTYSKRRIIGQFGVGFLSVLPFCQRYSIETKKKGSSEIVHATILSTEYFNDELKTIDVDEIPIQGGLNYNEQDIDEQYTRIRLIGFSKLTQSFFNSEYNIPNRRNTKTNFSPLELLRWELNEYLPIRFNEDDSDTGIQLNKLIGDESLIPFNVILNGQKLYRKLHAKTILEQSNSIQTIGELAFNYVLLSDFETIDPIEARYLMLRNHNVGVGERTTFNLGLDGKVYAKLAHITGEVFILSGLNELISVSRDKFNFSPDYEALKDFLRSRLSKWANDLDFVKSSERKIAEHQDTTKVSDILSLKKENFEKELAHLAHRGFKIQKSDFFPPTSFKIDQERKEVTVPIKPDTNYDKLIFFRNEEYKLQVGKWDLNDVLPAIRFTDGIYEINEFYPLFKEKNFDAYLKMHLILFQYLEKQKIDLNTYKNLVSELTSIIT